MTVGFGFISTIPPCGTENCEAILERVREEMTSEDVGGAA